MLCPICFKARAHVRAESRGWNRFSSWLRHFEPSLKLSPMSWIEDFRTKGDSACARVVSNDDFARELFRLDRRRRRHADARRVVRFGEHDAASVDRRAGYAGCYEPGRGGERCDADDTDAQLDPSARSKLLRRRQATSASRGPAWRPPVVLAIGAMIARQAIPSTHSSRRPSR
jgi:hypothetical protein